MKFVIEGPSSTKWWSLQNAKGDELATGPMYSTEDEVRADIAAFKKAAGGLRFVKVEVKQ